MLSKPIDMMICFKHINLSNSWSDKLSWSLKKQNLFVLHLWNAANTIFRVVTENFMAATLLRTTRYLGIILLCNKKRVLFNYIFLFLEQNGFIHMNMISNSRIFISRIFVNNWKMCNFFWRIQRHLCVCELYTTLLKDYVDRWIFYCPRHYRNALRYCNTYIYVNRNNS